MTSDARAHSEVPIRGDGAAMRPRTVYPALAFLGTVALTVVCLITVNSLPIREFFGANPFPPVGASEPSPGTADPLYSFSAAAALVASAMYPLYSPHRRRVLDTVAATLRSLLIVALILGTIGYFDLAVRLDRTTLALSMAVMAVAMPPWFVCLQRWRLDRTDGVLIVGNDPEQIEAAVEAASKPIVGYAYSPSRWAAGDGETRISTDGGVERLPPSVAKFECLGGLSRLDQHLRRPTVGTVIPALPRTDRAEFFGVLRTCDRHDVDVEILDEHDESVLLDDDPSGERPSPLLGIDLRPWSFRSRAVKRLFDVVFAGVGLLATLPLQALVAVAVKVDSRGPVLYAQRRTSQFGATFRVYKFRSMVPESESAVPGQDADRITRVGRVLRRTHLDELPQLWAILAGHMSVVGPRAAWTAEEELLQAEVRTWKKRWFVKPGLTGLAQINDFSSETPRAKLECDLEYIERQSLRLDATIVARQFRRVFEDVLSLIASRLPAPLRS